MRIMLKKIVRTTRVALCAAIVASLVSFTSAAQPPQAPLLVPFQGVVPNAFQAGDPATLAQDLVVKLFHDPNGVSLRDETHLGVILVRTTATGVSDGAFSLSLGAGVSSGMTLLEVFDGSDTTIKISVGAAAPFLTQSVFFVPMAAFASHVDVAEEVDRLANSGPDVLLTPPGTVLFFGGLISAVPAGWFPCIGQKVSKTQFQDLFNAIAERWGVDPPPNDDFFLPDFRGVFIRGVDESRLDQKINPDRTDRFIEGGQSASKAEGLGTFQRNAYAGHNHFFRPPLNSGFDASFSKDGKGAENTPDQNDNNGLEPNVWAGAEMGSGFSTAGTVTASETRPMNAYVEFIIKD